MALSSTPRLLTLHALRLKGIAEVSAVAAFMDMSVDVVEREIAELEPLDLVRYRLGRIPGYMLTPEGRVVGERLLAEELDDGGIRDRVTDAYREFLTFNDQLLAVCTAWQLRTVDGTPVVNDHSDEEYDAEVFEELGVLHARIAPVLDDLANTLTRFEGHRTRLQTALAKVIGGDDDYFTRPMFPSYHSNWFELHEDLLATLGTERGEDI